MELAWWVPVAVVVGVSAVVIPFALWVERENQRMRTDWWCAMKAKSVREQEGRKGARGPDVGAYR